MLSIPSCVVSQTNSRSLLKESSRQGEALPNKRDTMKMLFKCKEEGKVSFQRILSSEDSLKTT